MEELPQLHEFPGIVKEHTLSDTCHGGIAWSELKSREIDYEYDENKSVGLKNDCVTRTNLEDNVREKMAMVQDSYRMVASPSQCAAWLSCHT